MVRAVIGVVMILTGGVWAAPFRAGAAKVVEAQYEWPFQSHASMGPACAVADVRADGVTVWTGTQKPHYAAQGAAGVLGVPVEKVHAIWVTGPGSYGRNDAGDAVMDAAVLSQAVGKPVRVQYMRNEGHGWDPKAPASVHRARAALDKDGNVIAFEFWSRGFSRLETNSTESDPGDIKKRYSMHAFGAQFAEVAVDPDLGEIRLRRYTGVFAAGRILNAKTARSQMIGGIVYGMGMALLEATETDPKSGRIMNANIAEYLVPVHADVPAIDIRFVPEQDDIVNPLGAKGIGELPMVGVAAAIANAVFNATGKRIRDLPLTIDKVLMA